MSDRVDAPEIRSACEETLLFHARTSRPVSTLFIRAIALGTCLAAASASAQAPAAGSNWDHVKALPVQTRLHVSADKGGATCKLVTVDDATLVCGKHTFQRADVKSVKLTRYGVSYGVGTAIGAGAGAGVGVALVSGDSFFHDDKGNAAGIGLLLGGAVGALITGPADLFKGPTIYRRQQP
jgi:hypothetical protein